PHGVHENSRRLSVILGRQALAERLKARVFTWVDRRVKADFFRERSSAFGRIDADHAHAGNSEELPGQVSYQAKTGDHNQIAYFHRCALIGGYGDVGHAREDGGGRIQAVRDLNAELAGGIDHIVVTV